MILSAFGQVIEVIRENDEWIMQKFADGKRRRLNDFVIPAELCQREVVTFIADMLHESATSEFPTVEVIG